MKRSYFLTIFILLLINFQSRAQKEPFINGAYRNSVDFLNHKPLYQADFTFSPKYSKSVPALYYVRASNPQISNQKLFRNVWCIYLDGFFYLNAKRYGMRSGFIRIDSLETFTCFEGQVKNGYLRKERLESSFLMFGVVGYAVTSSRIHSENSGKIHFILNYKTGMVNLLTKNYLIRILQNYTDILLQFNLETEQESFEVLSRYIKMINAADNYTGELEPESDNP